MSPSQSIVPKVDQIRIVSADIEFTPYSIERIVSIPNIDGALLVDVGIRVSCGPIVPLDHKIAICPQDVHIILEYQSDGTIQSIDLTKQFLSALRKELDSQDQSILQLQYRSALDQWLATLSMLSTHRGRWHTRHVKTEEQKIAAQTLLNVSPLSENMNLLGDRTAGLQGRLHISNFLYRQIDVRAISLNSLISQSGAANSEKLSLGSLSNPKIICRHGANAISETSIIEKENAPAGALSISLECVYHNELADEFDDLEHKIKARLLEIHKKLIGDIQQDLANTQDELQDVLGKLSDITTFGTDFKTQLSSIEANLQAIQSKIAGLK